MGYSISQEIVVGFVVPLDWAFESGEMAHPPPCQHDNEEGTAFCSTCGKKLDVGTYHWQELRTDRGFEVDNDGAYDQPLLHLDRVTVQWLPPGPSSEEIILAGVWLLSLGDARQGDHGGHEQYDMPKPVDEQDLAKLLTEAGVPFNPDSYGLHLFTSGS